MIIENLWPAFRSFLALFEGGRLGIIIAKLLDKEKAAGSKR